MADTLIHRWIVVISHLNDCGDHVCDNVTTPTFVQFSLVQAAVGKLCLFPFPKQNISILFIMTTT